MHACPRCQSVMMNHCQDWGKLARIACNWQRCKVCNVTVDTKTQRIITE